MVALNTELLPTKLTSQELTALVAAWQGGALSQEDLYANLSQGNVLDPEVSFERWQLRLAQQAMQSLLTLPVRSQGPNGATPPAGNALSGQGV